MVAQPRYWVAEAEVLKRLAGKWERDWLLCIKNVTSATNERSAIGAVIPRAGAERSAPILLTRDNHLYVLWIAAALFSLAGDYIVRNKIGGVNLTLGYLEQLAVPPPERFSEVASVFGEPLAGFLTRRILELVYTASDLSALASDLGYDGPPFRWDPDRRALIRAELDASMFRVYGIERDDVAYILETFPVVRRRDEDRFGEYRTKRLVLERYDTLVAAEAAGALYATPLDPPPGDLRAAHHAPKATTAV
jgi:hypothetical protein